MTRVDEFLQAAERPNTLRSYASAVRHFEEEWRGLLPATSETIARYLADYATTLSSNTLRQRLSALSRWHTDQGFPDPTKAALVRQVFKGLRAQHPVTPAHVEKPRNAGFTRDLPIDRAASADKHYRNVGEAIACNANYINRNFDVPTCGRQSSCMRR